MKELSIEEKAKAYDEALKQIKECTPDENGFITIYPQEIFPELKESEDKKVRKHLISLFEKFVTLGVANECETSEIKVDDIFAWLEKQGEQNYKITKGKNYFCVKTHNYAGVKWIRGTKYYASDNYTLVNQGCEYYCPEYSKEEHNNLFEEVKYDGCVEKQCEQKLADKVEPKFKVGDWLVHNERKHIVKVVNLTPFFYKVVNILGYHYTIINDAIENNYHLWTIQDAKDGDVLLSPSTPEGDKECPFIFKEIDKSGIVRFYVALLQSEELKIADGITNVMGYANAGYHIPAAKEQRDLLFKRMKEAGYEWDAEEKELKKIEDEEYNGEDYGIDSLFHAQRILEKTLGSVDGYQSDDGILEHKCAISAVKKLYEQKPAWSEEDEQMIEAIIQLLYDTKSENCWNAIFVKTKDKRKEITFTSIENWLNSLKDRYCPQKRWKPTEEQIGVLNT